MFFVGFSVAMACKQEKVTASEKTTPAVQVAQAGGTINFDVEIVRQNSQNPLGAEVSCPKDKVAVGGGCSCSPSYKLRRSEPIKTGSTWGWSCNCDIDSGDESKPAPGSTLATSAFAVCAPSQMKLTQ